MATRISPKGEETRAIILDAAEILFSRHGYNGTSLRDITNAARVRLSLVHYHFGNKHDIFSAAIDRKIDRLHDLMAQSFATAERASAPAPLTIEQTIAAFVSPFLTIVAMPGHDLHHFVIMTSHLMSSYRMPELRPALSRLGVVSDLFESRVKALMPDASEADVLAGIYLIESSLIFIMQDPGFLDDLSRDHHSVSTIDGMAAPMIRFFAAGIERLATRT